MPDKLPPSSASSVVEDSPENISEKLEGLIRNLEGNVRYFGTVRENLGLQLEILDDAQSYFEQAGGFDKNLTEQTDFSLLARTYNSYRDAFQAFQEIFSEYAQKLAALSGQVRVLQQSLSEDFSSVPLEQSAILARGTSLCAEVFDFLVAHFIDAREMSQFLRASQAICPTIHSLLQAHTQELELSLQEWPRPVVLQDLTEGEVILDNIKSKTRKKITGVEADAGWSLY